MAKINWKNEGWTSIQEVDASKHVLGISCRTEGGKVVEVRIRHNDGEEVVSKVKIGGNLALPMSIEDFQKSFEKSELTFE